MNEKELQELKWQDKMRKKYFASSLTERAGQKDAFLEKKNSIMFEIDTVFYQYDWSLKAWFPSWETPPWKE